MMVDNTSVKSDDQLKIFINLTSDIINV